MSAPLLIAGGGHPALAVPLASLCGAELGQRQLGVFPDGELQLELSSEVRGRDVYLLQPLRAPVGESLLELQLLADAARRKGARRLTALVPYLGYARQDRRVTGNEALGSKVVADAISHCVDQVVVVNLHSAAVEGCFSRPVTHLSAERVLCAHLGKDREGSVVVSPDLGAVKLAERYAAQLGLPLAVVHKHRLSGSEVSARGVVGAVQGLKPILVDDMISTAGTMAAAAEALLAQGCAPHFTVVATHGLFVGQAQARLASFPLQELVVTDSLPLPEGLGLPVQVVSIAPLLAQAVREARAGS